MKIIGTVTFEDISGGFWGIIGDNGRKFRPVKGLAEGFQQVGLRVKVEAELADGFSIFMWGTEIEVRHIAILKAAESDATTNHGN